MSIRRLDALASSGIRHRSRYVVALVLMTGAAVQLPAAADGPGPDPATVHVPLQVVTATGREAPPVSAIVVDGAAFDDEQLRSLQDLSERVPGLSVTAPTARLTTLSLRGLGASPFNDGVESPVLLVLDGVPLNRPAYGSADLLDLERVEVIRGPLGALIGRNATAGALVLHSRLPSTTPEAEVRITQGNLGREQWRASVSGPLAGPDWSGRLSGQIDRRHGLLDNRFDGGTLNDRDKSVLRGQVLWTLDEALSARLIADYAHADEACCAYPLLAPIREQITARDAFMEYTRSSPDPHEREADLDGRTRGQVRQGGVSLELSGTTQGAARWQSISAWRSWDYLPHNDDGTSMALVDNGTTNRYRLLHQGLRMEQQAAGWAVSGGLDLMREEVRGREEGRLGADLIPWVFGGQIREQIPFATRRNAGAVLEVLIPARTVDGMVVTTPYEQRTDSASLHGALRWPWRSDLDLTVALRYTHDWKRATVSRDRTGGDPDASPLALTNALGPLGDLIGRDLSGLSFEALIDATVGGPFARRDRHDEGGVAALATLDWRLTNSTAAYLSVARGYKSGGINLGVTGVSTDPVFEPETALGVELGLRTRAGAALAGELAVYQTTVRHYQALTFDEDITFIPNPRLTNLLNVGRVRLQGVELQGRWTPGHGLHTRGGLAYNRAITLDFDNAPDEDARTSTRDLGGRPLFNAPRWSTTLGLGLERPLPRALRGYGYVDHHFRSSTYGTVERGRSSRIPAYALANAGLGLRTSDPRWDVQVWVRNLFDRDYLAAVQALYGVGDYGGFAGEPRTWGISLQLGFGGPA